MRMVDPKQEQNVLFHVYGIREDGADLIATLTQANLNGVRNALTVVIILTVFKMNKTLYRNILIIKCLL